MATPKSVGAHSPIKIACCSRPLKNKYSDTIIMSAQIARRNRLGVPNFLKKFINLKFINASKLRKFFF
tara:strand:- start:8 stop:211 length:204 start_codon:yes stop_codon:yes gene_type:complete